MLTTLKLDWPGFDTIVRHLETSFEFSKNFLPGWKNANQSIHVFDNEGLTYKIRSDAKKICDRSSSEVCTCDKLVAKFEYIFHLF